MLEMGKLKIGCVRFTQFKHRSSIFKPLQLNTLSSRTLCTNGFVLTYVLHLHRNITLIFNVFIDVDECGLRTHNCHEFANCTNTVGHFTCRCIDGYTGNGKLCQGQ